MTFPNVFVVIAWENPLVLSSIKFGFKFWIYCLLVTDLLYGEKKGNDNRKETNLVQVKGVFSRNDSLNVGRKPFSLRTTIATQPYM